MSRNTRKRRHPVDWFEKYLETQAERQIIQEHFDRTQYDNAGPEPNFDVGGGWQMSRDYGMSVEDLDELIRARVEKLRPEFEKRRDEIYREIYGWPAGKENMFNLQDAIKNLATDLSTAEPAPGFWADWVTYLLEQLQARAESADQRDEFDNMLQALEKDLQARIQSGRW